MRNGEGYSPDSKLANPEPPRGSTGIWPLGPRSDDRLATWGPERSEVLESARAEIERLRGLIAEERTVNVRLREQLQDEQIRHGILK